LSEAKCGGIRRRRHCEEQSDEAIHPSFFAALWIASRILSSGAHSRDPLVRNDGFGRPAAIDVDG